MIDGKLETMAEEMLMKPFLELVELEMALAFRDEYPEEAVKAIRESNLNKLTPNLCSTLLAALCISAAK